MEAEFQMWVTFGVIFVALTLYALERLALEVTSIAVIAFLLIFFHFFPVPGGEDANRLDPERLLSGFANPALVAVVALLIVGQGLVHTGVLDRAAHTLFRIGGSAWRSILLVLVTVIVVSAVLNNIPVVVIFIPIMQALADKLGRSASGLMMPLSFAAILGGMTTLIGSSTNLLVSGTMVDMNLTGFGFFDFTIPGLIMASVGLIYIFFFAPRMLPDRASLATAVIEGGDGKQFIAQITVGNGSKLVGAKAVGGFFPSLTELTVRMVQRREHAYVPPFEDLSIRPGDIVVLAGTRQALMAALRDDPGLLHHDSTLGGNAAEDPKRQQMLAEIMITPASRMAGRNLEQIGFRYQFGAIVLGIQRRSRMIRAQMTEIRLEPGDVLLIQGAREAIENLRGNPDLVLMEWSAADLPSSFHANRAILIFAGMVAAAASGALPIAVAALTAAGLMLGLGCLNIRQATRAIDRNVVLMIAAALALGAAMQETGGGQYLADALLAALTGAPVWVILSFFFLMVSLLANVLSTKACAVLFTPIAIGIAQGLGTDPVPFAIAVVFGANCSFASPIGYQTNLLVMAPGHYRFLDFMRAGLPLVFILWLVFTAFVPWYYGLLD